ncbi:MAG: hypothetical protein HC902_08525, partial [Calothrix sp. SM1_5_4]|nr:hypothetical protein [Calothrix sp. SM1_5_4]
MPNHPEIKELSPRDPLFRQLTEDIELARMALSQTGRQRPALVLYRYQPRSTDSVFGFSSHFSLPYDTVASLNRVESSVTEMGTGTILVPNQPGLFVPETPRSELERMMAGVSEAQRVGGERVLIAGEDDSIEAFWFFPGELFTSIERSFFLRIVFRYPPCRRPDDLVLRHPAQSYHGPGPLSRGSRSRGS